MIRISSFEVLEANKDRKVVFSLKTSRDVWLAEDKLILEYPVKFDELDNLGEAAIFSLLPIAFHEDSDIELPVELPLERETWGRVSGIVALWNDWFGCRRKIHIHASVKPGKTAKTTRWQAQLFSGGADSLATYVRHRHEVKYLILFHGADIRLTRSDRFVQISAVINDFARRFGHELVTIVSNANYLSNVSWPHVSHSSMMLGACFALSGYIKKIYIASSFSGISGLLTPWGSHPILDIQIRTNSVETVHDGFELKRSEKIKLIAKDHDLLRILRVCGVNLSDGLNCGQCEKCLRTILILRLIGVSPEMTAFPGKAFGLSEFSRIFKDVVLPVYDKELWCDNLEFLEASATKIDGAAELAGQIRDKLGSFYLDYLRGFPGGLPQELSYKSKWRLLEKSLHLPSDSLKWIKKIIRYLRGKGYADFVEEKRRYM